MDDDASESSRKRGRLSNDNDSDKEDESKYTKGTWSKEEDDRLVDAVRTHGTDNWKAVASMVTGRSAKQCRDRYKLKLDPTINHGPWTKAEDDRLMELANEYGRAWTKIARNMPGRTENAVKSRISSLERSRTKDWSKEEDDLLVDLKKNGLDFEQMTSHFRSRSSHAIKKRWETLHMDELARKLRQDMNPKPQAMTMPSTTSANGPSNIPLPVALGQGNSTMQQSTQGSLAGGNSALGGLNPGLQTHLLPFTGNMPMLNHFNSQTLMGLQSKPHVAQPPVLSSAAVQTSRMVRHSTSMTVLLKVLGDQPDFQNISPLQNNGSSTLREYPSFSLPDHLSAPPSLDAANPNSETETPAKQLLQSLLNQGFKSE